MTSTWGPQVWCFLHTLVSKINSDSFYLIGNQSLTYITKICSMLPCPDCSNHARMFFSRINPSFINTRQKLIDLIYLFHNDVNKRTKKTLQFPYSSLDIYENNNLYKCYNDFVKVYKINTSSKLNADTFQKEMLLKNLHKWLITNHSHFLPPSSPSPSTSTSTNPSTSTYTPSTPTSTPSTPTSTHSTHSTPSTPTSPYNSIQSPSEPSFTISSISIHSSHRPRFSLPNRFYLQPQRQSRQSRQYRPPYSPFHFR